MGLSGRSRSVFILAIVAILGIGEAPFGRFRPQIGHPHLNDGVRLLPSSSVPSHEPEEEGAIDTVKTSRLLSTYPKHAVDVIGCPFQYSRARWAPSALF